MINKNILMIQEVAKGLRDIIDDVAFVGGSAVSLYLDLDIASEVRPTEDVDVVIEVASRVEYQKLSEKLTSMKFAPDSTVGAPICRWKYLGIAVDIMPLDENILGFSNRHYIDGFSHKKQFTLPDGQQIYIFSLGYFLASKIGAFFGRGIEDPRFSSDLEDIVTLLSDAKDFDSVSKEKSIVPFLRKSFEQIFNDPNCNEAIKGFLAGSVAGQYDRIVKRAKL